ncbi:MAG: radical SAM protein [Methanophagales archaeon ANME-1-THS]|nr:MAG: radical SAM protein [Methanophagales archaeon ANME-1-THS]
MKTMSAFIRTTKSICPVCYHVIDASLYEENGAVYMEKRCAEHGAFKDLCWSDYQLYQQFESKDTRGAGRREVTTATNGNGECPFACGLCPQHESSTVLGVIDVTMRCNLSCPTCFAGSTSKGERHEKDPHFEHLKAIIDNFALNTNAAGLQFSGGEPTLREDLPELIAYARRKFDHVEVNTNGLKMAASPEYCKELESAGTSVIYLQFDGVTEAPYEQLRGRKLLGVKKQAIENHRTAGPKPAIVLVPTIVKGINDDQIGAIINFAIENSAIIRGVNFQPVSFCGRTLHDHHERITVSDVIRKVEEQTGFLRREDFFPPSMMSMLLGTLGKSEAGCHFSCGAFSYLVVGKKGKAEGKIEPITKYLDLDKLAAAYTKNKRISALTAVRHIHPSFLKELFIKFLKSHTYEDLSDLHFNLLFIGAMHFMDPSNFDLARVRRCVIHYGLPDGRIVPFCSYNTIHRKN